VPRARKKCIAGRNLKGLACVHHDHFVADLPGGSEVVRRKKDRDAAFGGDPAKQGQNLHLHRHVEGSRRLVGNYDPWLRQQGHRNEDTLPLAPRQLMGIFAHDRSRLRQLDSLKHREGRVFLGPPGGNEPPPSGASPGPAHQISNLRPNAEERVEAG
jgi:hypothetical protein